MKVSEAAWDSVIDYVFDKVAEFTRFASYSQSPKKKVTEWIVVCHNLSCILIVL